jgi:peptidoglycan/xylan/chitin deacetylase (PgdA/CDA1 family)
MVGRVSITFDDGLASVHSLALPEMETYGMTGTAFVISDHIGGQWEGHHVMNEEMLIDLSSAGWEIGSHTKTHPHLVSLTTQQLDEELEISKQCLESLVKKPVTSLSYPYGEFDSAVALRAKRYYTCARSIFRAPPLRFNSFNPKDLMQLKGMSCVIEHTASLPTHLYLTHFAETTPKTIHRILQKGKRLLDHAAPVSATSLNVKIFTNWIRKMHRNAWLILCFHNIAETTAPSPYSISLDNFRGILKAIASNSEQVVTVQAGIPMHE